MSAHTPGPWEVWPDFDEEGETGRLCVGPRECPVACTCGEGTEADAKLIAAAPALLAEAMELIRNAECADGVGVVLTQDIEALEAAIAKATGEPS